MKKLVLMTVFSLLRVSSFASELSCKKLTKATAQGYEAKVSGRTATIEYKGKKVARLVLVSSQKSSGEDQMSVDKYRQQVINGYGLDIKKGGIADITAATILHDGIAGFMPVAELNDCK